MWCRANGQCIKLLARDIIILYIKSICWTESVCLIWSNQFCGIRQLHHFLCHTHTSQIYWALQYYWYYNNFCILTAIADQDYAGLPTTFSFVTGQSLSCILIEIIDDNIEERKETLSLILQPLDSSPGVRISRGQSIVEITDNDVGKFTLLRRHMKKIFLLSHYVPSY